MSGKHHDNECEMYSEACGCDSRKAFQERIAGLSSEVPAYFTANHAIAMTIRDYFAARAMSAIVSTHAFDKLMLSSDPSESIYEETARKAYSAADAMMEARKK